LGVKNLMENKFPIALRLVTLCETLALYFSKNILNF